MNQEPGDCVAAYLGLQGFAVVAVELVQHPGGGGWRLCASSGTAGSASARSAGGARRPGCSPSASRSACGTVRSASGRPTWRCGRCGSPAAGGGPRVAAAVGHAGLPHDAALLRAAGGAVHAAAGRGGGRDGTVVVGDGGEGRWACD